jgi:hypothetical protein
MVRRAILDRGDTLAPEDQALPPGQLPVDPAQQPGRHWRGAGGRWLFWVGRAVVWAVLLLIGYRGVLAIVTGQPSGTSAKPAVSATSSASFPVTLAEAYALQFGRVYLTFSPAGAALRAQQLARFVAAGQGTDPQLGWNGAGTEYLDSVQVAGIEVTGPHSAVVTLLASVNSGRMLELAVPVYAARGAISVSAAPALLPGPVRAEPPAASPAPSDPATTTALQSQLPAFFAAYASGDRTTLARFAAPGSHIRSLAGAVILGGIDSVYVPAGGTTRIITVTVTWKLASSAGASGPVASAPASLQMTYQLTVIRQGSSWDVQAIGALTGPQVQPLAAGPP